jgi:hypothetical protein
VTICGINWWKFMWRGPSSEWIGIFTNKPGVIPGRWGFYVLGFEFGSRNPQDRFGVWLKRIGLWPW